MTTVTAISVRDRDRVPGDQALLLLIAGAQRRLAQHHGRRRPHLRRVLDETVDDLPPSVRPAVRPVLAAHRHDIERALRDDADASPSELLRQLRSVS